MPPLRIHHLMAATAVTAVFLSFMQLLQRSDSLGLAAFVRSGMGVSYAISTSLALTVVGFGVYWRRQGIPFLHQPGHWLLVALSLNVWIVVLGVYMWLEQQAEQDRFASLDNLWWFFIAWYLSALGVYGWAAWKGSDSLRWRLVFTCKGLMLLANIALPFLVSFFSTPASVGYLHAYVHVGTGLLVLVTLIAAAFLDWRTRRARDWPHWFAVFLSIGVYLFAYVPQLALAIAQWLAETE